MAKLKCISSDVPFCKWEDIDFYSNYHDRPIGKEALIEFLDVILNTILTEEK